MGGWAISSLIETLGKAHTSSPAPTSTSNGADRVSSHLIDSAPRSTTHRFRHQNSMKPITSPVPPKAFQSADNDPRNR
ncbi:hypothetical protein D3C80_1354720 [compost metagenome]